MPAKRFVVAVVLVAVGAWGSLVALRQRSPTRASTLSFTPHRPSGAIQSGRTSLGLDSARDGFIFVPRGNSERAPAPLLVLLHGATQRSRLFERITPLADSLGVVIVAPDSRDITWDAIRDDFGADVAFINHAITRAFDRAYVDRCRVVIGGFSDGASYGLSLGIRNARLLAGVVAFSPGFVIPVARGETLGKLPLFVRHGRNDEILPIDRTSRRLVPMLRDAGFDVNYAEFDGPHTMLPAHARAALEWVKRRGCR